MARDPKGFYQKALDGKIKNFTGVDSIYEVPKNADILLDTDKNTARECVEKLFVFAQEKGIISKENNA